MDPWALLLDILIVLVAAVLLGILFERLRQGAIVGYLVAGIVLGPHVLNLIEGEERVHFLSELGVALLLFSIGLEFSWKEMKHVGRVAFLGGTMQVVLTTALAALIGMALGLHPASAAAFGLMLAMSSTATVLRTLESRSELDSVHGRSALGILLMQDVAIIPATVAVQALGSAKAPEVSFEQLLSLLAVLAMFGVFYILFNKVVSPLLGAGFVARNRDFPISLAFVTVLGAAWMAHLVGMSPALGAFVAGILLAGSPFASQVRNDIASLRTPLVMLFFVSIGMLANLAWLIDNWYLVLLVTVGIVAIKGFLTAGIVRLFSPGWAVSIATGVALAQVGEFSFVLAQIGRGAAIDDELFHLLVSVALVTLFVTPLMVSKAPRIGRFLSRRWGRNVVLPDNDLDEGERRRETPRALVIGFGPAGREVVAKLREAGASITVLDLSPQGVRDARAMNIAASHGDASNPDILAHSAAADADLAILTIPDHRSAAVSAKYLRQMNPNIRIVVRARYHIHVPALEKAGADVVVDEEHQVGRQLAAAALGCLQKLPNGSEVPSLEQ